MLFNSFHFLCFFPFVVTIFFLIPHRLQNYMLLICSYYFYMSWNPRYAVLIAASTLITYLSGRLIAWSHLKKNAKQANAEKRLWVFLSFAANLSILFVFKYFDFAVTNINHVLSAVGMQLIQPEFDVMLPVGISFYTFQALSYTVDVYRGELPAEKSIMRYALYVSFFPQLVAGPIERSASLLEQFYTSHQFDYDRVKRGLLLMMWGYFQKLIIADRASVLVDAVYDNVYAFSGVSIIVATLLFAVQIYCDFAGYSNIAIGAAQVLGIRLMDNFKQPYFATSIQDFWHRWHISLSTWFRDYLYIPMGGSRLGTVRKYSNLLITFFVSGLWHGASWSYVAWGGLHGIYQVVGNLLKPLRTKLLHALKVSDTTPIIRIIRTLGTFLLVDFAWIFFRAPGIRSAILAIKKVLTETRLEDALIGSSYILAGDEKNFMILCAAIMLLFAVEALQYFKGFQFREIFLRQNTVVRWILYYLFVIAILYFGVVVMSTTQAQFIYFQF